MFDLPRYIKMFENISEHPQWKTNPNSRRSVPHYVPDEQKEVVFDDFLEVISMK